MKRPIRFALLAVTLLAFRLAAAEPAELAALRVKAENGNALAQYNLGLAYAQGTQVPVDLTQSFMWLSLASENGSTGKALETVLGNINDEQLAEGRRLLAANRAAYAPRAATPTMSRSTFRKLSNRTFSLGAQPGSTPTPAPVVRADAPARAHVAVDPLPSEAEQLSRLRQENAQLRAELIRSTNQIEEQAETISKLQERLAMAPVVPASAETSKSNQGLVAGGPLR